MKRLSITGCLALLALLLWSGCASSSGPGTRISQNQVLFHSYSPAEQRLIRSGQIAVGFDRDMVHMAYGEPSHRHTRAGAGGSSMVWEYDELQPRVGAFVGATVRRGVDAGVGVSGSPTRTKLRKRVVFGPNGTVTQFQSFD